MEDLNTDVLSQGYIIVSMFQSLNKGAAVKGERMFSDYFKSFEGIPAMLNKLLDDDASNNQPPSSDLPNSQAQTTSPAEFGLIFLSGGSLDGSGRRLMQMDSTMEMDIVIILMRRLTNKV